MIVAIRHWSYLLFTFLRSLFIVHDWNRPVGATIRSCRVCGRREELDVDDGVNLAAWHPVWEGYPGAHFARRGAAHDGARLPATGGSAGLADQNITALPVGTTNVLARVQSAGD
jgi:hypothetical protein